MVHMYTALKDSPRNSPNPPPPPPKGVWVLVVVGLIALGCQLWW